MRAILSLRLFSLFIALFAGFIRLNPRGGALHVLVWGQKNLASSLAPLLALLSGLSVLLGLKRKDLTAMGAGSVAAAIAANHILDVTAPREKNFAAAFGPGWESRIPADLRPRLTPYRWRPLVKKRPHGPLHRNVIYGLNSDTGQSLVADLMEPPPGVPCAGLAMIFVHGGGWWYGRKNIGKFPYFRLLASQGYVVMDIDYTLSPHSSVPGMVKDVKQAILWLKQNAVACRVNPERIALAGQSAGGHLSLLAAYTPNHSAFQPDGAEGDTSVRGVISYYGPPDMAAVHDDIQARYVPMFPNRLVETTHRLLETFGYRGTSLALGLSAVVGGTPDELPETYRLLSPTTYVSAACPPTLLFQGTHDLLVDHRQVETLYHQLRQAGVPAIYIPFPGCDHSFESVLPKTSPAAQTAAYYMERFLALLL